jgi:hypothetical protein
MDAVVVAVAIAVRFGVGETPVTTTLVIERIVPGTSLSGPATDPVLGPATCTGTACR